MDNADNEGAPPPLHLREISEAIASTEARIELALDEWMTEGRGFDDALMLLAGAQAVLERARRVIGVVDAELMVVRKLTAPDPVDEPAPPAPPAGARHRHNYDAAGVCSCGKVKSASAGGRPRKSAAVAVDGVAKIDPPSARLPLGDAAADKFAGGGLGSSGVRR